MAVVENGLDCKIVENGFETLNSVVVVENGLPEVSQSARKVLGFTRCMGTLSVHFEFDQFVAEGSAHIII